MKGYWSKWSKCGLLREPKAQNKKLSKKKLNIGADLLLSRLCTSLPTTCLSVSFSSANSISAGQLLCGGLFSADSLSNWCAAVALAHALQDNLTQKEQLLRVQLATSLGKPPVSLLQQCTNILSQVPSLSLKIFQWLLQSMCWHFARDASIAWPRTTIGCFFAWSAWPVTG